MTTEERRALIGIQTGITALSRAMATTRSDLAATRLPYFTQQLEHLAQECAAVLTASAAESGAPSIDRLAHLAGVVEAMPTSQRFNLDYFAAFWTRDLGASLHRYEPISPGTDLEIILDAVGYGALDPILQAEGLHLTGQDGEPLLTLEALLASTTPRFFLRYGDLTDWEACKAFFDLDDEQGIHLFSSGEYDTSTPLRYDVARRIRAFVANGRTPEATAEPALVQGFM